MARPVVFLGIPHRGTLTPGTLKAVLTAGKVCRLLPYERSCSLLTHNFNLLWCAALNRREAEGITHFVMLHDDIEPEPDWLDSLLEEYDASGADILAAVSPIKDRRGLTSTALFDPETKSISRLTVRQVAAIKRDTFDSFDVGQPEKLLLANTGLWICDIRKPWVDQACFRQLDRIIRDPDGMLRPSTLSEDWLFSLDAHARGQVVKCTKRIKLKHYGIAGYTSGGDWGEVEVDVPEQLSWL